MTVPRTSTFHGKNEVGAGLRMNLEVNDNNVYSGNNLSASDFSASINTLPGGATLTYNSITGNEDILVPDAAGYIGNMVLHNTTRGTSALISDCNTTTNTITLTDSVPAGWQTSDSITVRSQTNTGTISGGAAYFVDIKLNASGALGASYILLEWYWRDATNTNRQMSLHPYESDSNPKRASRFSLAANIYDVNQLWIPLISDTVCAAWNPSSSNGQFILRLNGWA